MSGLNLIREIPEKLSRENFKRIETYIENLPLLKGQFNFIEQTLSDGSYPATVRVYHSLGFAPKDILVTSVIGGTITWDYASATTEYIEASISAETTFRAFFGTYAEGRTI